MSSELQVNETAHTLEIRVGNGDRSRFGVAVFLVIWLCGWTFGEFFALASLFGKGTPLAVRGFFLIWVIPWTIGGGFAILSLMKLLGGYERIEAGRGILKITKSFLLFRYTKTYDIFKISRMMKVGKQPGKYNIFNNGVITYRYQGREVRFGGGLSASGKDRLFGLLRGHDDFSDKNFA